MHLKRGEQGRRPGQFSGEAGSADDLYDVNCFSFALTSRCPHTMRMHAIMQHPLVYIPRTQARVSLDLIRFMAQLLELRGTRNPRPLQSPPSFPRWHMVRRFICYEIQRRKVVRKSWHDVRAAAAGGWGVLRRAGRDRGDEITVTATLVAERQTIQGNCGPQGLQVPHGADR